MNLYIYIIFINYILICKNLVNYNISYDFFNFVITLEIFIVKTLSHVLLT